MSMYSDKPCQRCGWKFKTFHICLELEPAVMRQIKIAGPKKPRKSRAKPWNGMTHGQIVSAAIRANPKRIARDKEIERLYDEQGLSIKQVAASMGLADRTVMSALHRAQANGRLVVRRPGQRSPRCSSSR